MPANPIAQYPQTGGASFPPATGAGQVPVSTGAGTTYTAQNQAWTLIQEQVLGSSAASVTFSSLPTTSYKYFKLLIAAGNAGNTATAYQLNFNGDATAANYFLSTVVYQFNTNSALVAGGFSNAGLLVAPNNSETTFYLSATGAFISTIGCGATGSVATLTGGGQWNNASLLASMVIIPVGSATFSTGGTFSLFGIQ